jgi:hypothetical protein
MKMVFSIFVKIRNSLKNSSELTKICNFRYFVLQISVIANITTFPFSRKFSRKSSNCYGFLDAGLLPPGGQHLVIGVVADVLICILLFS